MWRVCLLAILILVGQAGSSPWTRARDMLLQLSQEEKLGLVGGGQGPFVGQLTGVPRLGLPSLTMEDGPQGVADGTKQVTAWPSANTVAQSWNLSSFFLFAAAAGAEQRAKGVAVMLGPMMNLARVPEGARNFEALGEDPFLAARLAEQSVRGIQSNKILCNIKHFINNDDDPVHPSSRFNYSVSIDPTTQYLYLQPFEAAIRAGALSVMCSYNRVNGVFACENNYTLGLLKGPWLNFTGFVVSDWGATHSTIPSALAGLDVEMPRAQFYGKPLKDALDKGLVPQSRLDDMVYRVLLAMFAVGIVDDPPPGNLSVPVDSAAHALLAQELAAESAVLLQNRNNILPFQVNQQAAIPFKIMVCGKGGSNAGDMVAGGGSGSVIPPFVVAARQGLASYVAEKNLTKAVEVGFVGDDPLVARLECAKSDVCVVIIQVYTSEGEDRKDLSIGVLQQLYLDAVLSVSKHSVVVIHIASPVLVGPFKDKTDAIITMGYPGQEDGNALAKLLFGERAFAGRLTITWPSSQAQLGFSPSQWPGIPAKDPCINECKRETYDYHEMTYSEKMLFGYRWYDAQSLKPQYPFGFGLTYTTFEWSDFSVLEGNSSLVFTCTVRNAGSASAAPDVVQLYVAYPEMYQQPPRQLKGFQKTLIIQPGGWVQVSIRVVPSRDLMVWNSKLQRPSVASGQFVGYFQSDAATVRGKVVFEI